MRPRLSLLLVGLLLTAATGWAGEGVVALQTAEPSCRTTTTPPPRYVDCGNGTVTDNGTGLVWLKNADCFGRMTWRASVDRVSGLSDLQDSRDCPDLTADECDCGLSDGSSPGEWRLPSTYEWYATVGPGVRQCLEPVITDDAGDGCWDQECVDLGACSFYGVQLDSYWTTTPYVLAEEFVWIFYSIDGLLAFVDKTAGSRVWPVRAGQ